MTNSNLVSRRNHAAGSDAVGSDIGAARRSGRWRSPSGRFLAGLTLAAAMLAIMACASPEEKLAKYTKEGQEFLADGKLGKANVQFKSALEINEEHIPALIGLSEIAEQKSDFQAMYGVLQNIVRIAPENIDSIIKLGQLYLVGSDETQALEYAEKALALDPKNPSAMGLKAGILLRLENTAEAVEIATAALEIDSGNAEAVTVLATERSLAKDHEGALAFLDAGIEAAPKAAVLHLLRMQILSKLERTEEVEAGHLLLIEAFPENPAYRRLYVTTLIKQEKLDEARAQLVEVARLQPKKIDPVLDVIRIDYRMGGADKAGETFKAYLDERPDNIDLKFAFAGFLRQENDIAGAEAIYQAMSAKSNPDDVILRAKNEVARVRLLEGKNSEAKALIAEILQADARNTDALLKQAGLKINEGRFDDAVLDLRTVLDDSPDSLTAKMLMATAFENKGDIEYAINQMAQAVEGSGAKTGPSHLFARLLLRANQPARAEKVLVESLARFPNDSKNLKLLAAVRLAQQDWRGAEEIANLINDIDDEDPVVGRILGEAYAGLEDYSGAIDVLKTSNDRAPLASRPLATLIAAYVESGRQEEAERLLLSTIENTPDNYQARMLLAEVYRVGKRPNDSREVLRAAIDLAPRRGGAYEALYRLYMREGRRDDAETLILQGLKVAPGNDGLRVLLADLRISGGEPEAALPIYEEILSRRPRDLLVSNNYASLLGELRDDAASRAKAVEIAKVLEGHDNAFFLDTLGWAQYRNGDAGAAVKNLARAVAGAPGLVEARYHFGVALLAAGETEQARAELENVVKTEGAPAKYVIEARKLLEPQ